MTVLKLHPARVFTVTEPPPPAEDILALLDPRLTVQFTPVSVTVRVWPAIVAVKVWVLAVVLGGMVTVTVPLLAPAPGVAPSPVAVQLQDELDAVIAMVAIPPADVTCRFAGLIANEQPEPNCVMV